MGNCTTSTHSRLRSRLTSSFFSSNDDVNRSTQTHRSTRQYHNNNLDALIDETLLMIRTVMDNDQEPPYAMFLVARLAHREERWLDVVLALIDRIPIDDPLGATVIALLLDECSLPSKELLQLLIKRVCSNNSIRLKFLQSTVDDYLKEKEKDLIVCIKEEPSSHHEGTQERRRSSLFKAGRVLKRISAVTKAHTHHSTHSNSVPRRNEDELHRDRNILVVLACLAERLVGPTSTSMLSEMGLEFIIDRAYLGIYHYEDLKDLTDDDYHRTASIKYNAILKIVLFALVAIEKFSHTSESKYIFRQSLTLHGDATKQNLLEYYEPWVESRHYLQRQIGFYAQYLLDNVFLLENRRPTYETLDHRSINVMLNDKDVSEYLKIGPDGLEARSDTVSFESVRCTFAVSSGVWYYEVLIVTEGVMQIGWAAKQSKFMNHEGYGIGDDQYSVAYDGCRNLIWFGAKSIPHNNPRWRPGDILGCLIDFNRREVVFSLNGQCLEAFQKLFSSSSSSPPEPTTGFFAAASFMSYQQCRFNFGATPFRYPPTTVKSFQTFNRHGYLSDANKLILPKYKKLEILRLTNIKENDCILCVDLPADVTLKPCQHNGFCQVCALKLDSCPICRAIIRERSIESN